MLSDMWRQRLALGIGIVVIAALPSSVHASAPTEAGTGDAGDVVVVDPINVDRTLADGDSTSTFTFRLPDAASCPGDSANDDWRVSTFLVPADTNLDTLMYQALSPDGEAYRSLRYVDGDIYVMEMTSPNPGPGQPGLINQLPALTMAWYETGTLAPGPYKMGIACTDAVGAVERYWDTDVELTVAPDVEPGGLRWSVIANANVAAVEPSSNGSAIWVFILVAIAAIGGFIVVRRRRSLTPHNQKKTV